MKLKEFLGNNEMVAVLRRSQLPQASLFTGPNGIGKRTLALRLAALTNCQRDDQEDTCGECSSCVKAGMGNHPDILLYQPEKNLIRIDAMRGLNREARFRPFEGELRFFIIDQAETLTPEAANSILKTLEEPPATSRIILVTAFPNRLLATIRSRCQSFSFRPLRQEEIQTYVADRFPENPRMRASFADGSIGAALELDLEETLRDRDQVLELLVGCCRHKKSFEFVYKTLERPPLRSDLKKRQRVRRYLDLLQMLVEDLYFLRVSTHQRVINQDRLDQLDELSRNLSLSLLMDLLYDIDKSRWDLDHYVSPLMCFETLWLNVPSVPKDA